MQHKRQSPAQFCSHLRLIKDSFTYVRPGQVDREPRSIGAVKTDKVNCELLTFSSNQTAEIELSGATHSIIFLPDGMSGTCEWRSDERAGKLSSMLPNSVIFNPDDGYLCLQKKPSRAPCRLMLLTIAPTAIIELYGDKLDILRVEFIQRIGIDDKNLHYILLSLVNEIEDPRWNSNSYVELLLTLALHQLARCLSSVVGVERKAYKKGGLPNLHLNQALELLEQSFRETPSLAKIADHLQLHPASFCRAFKQSTGLSPHRYLLCHRIRCAKEMMGKPTRTLTDIALDCGFSSSSHFSVVFRKLVGISPREYRRSL